MHVDESVLEPVRARYGQPVSLRWQGEISDAEWRLATYDPARRHDVTVFVLRGGELALIRKHRFPPGVWRPPGGGVKPGEPFADAVRREAFEETGADVRLERYLVAAEATFTHDGAQLAWSTHVVSARTETETLRPVDVGEIAQARWGTIQELAGPLRERLLATGRALWRYRVALHEAAIAALETR